MVVWWAVGFSMGRIFDGNGNPLTDVFYLGPQVAEENEGWGKPTLDADDIGNFITVYEYGSDLTADGLYATIRDTNGQIVEEIFPVLLSTKITDTPDVACLSAGRFVSVWRDYRTTGNNGDIYAKIMSNDHWVAPLDPIPVAGPLGIGLLIAGLGWALRRKLR
jgi:hypothetical protein